MDMIDSLRNYRQRSAKKVRRIRSFYFTALLSLLCLEMFEKNPWSIKWRNLLFNKGLRGGLLAADTLRSSRFDLDQSWRPAGIDRLACGRQTAVLDNALIGNDFVPVVLVQTVENAVTDNGHHV